MKLIKGFPEPSCHMGVLLVLSQIPGLIVVEFGAEGTMRYFLNALQMMGHPAKARMFTTMMDESSVVLGSYERLRKTLRELDEEYRHSAIIVVDSTIASVIGADISGACREFQSETCARLVSIEENGLSKSFSQGMQLAAQCLADNQIVAPSVMEEAQRLANLLAPNFMTGQYNAKL